MHHGYPGGTVIPISSGVKVVLSIDTPTPTFAAFCTIQEANHQLQLHAT